MELGRPRLLLCALLAWIGFAFVWFTSRGGFVWDDFLNFRDAQTHHLSLSYLTSPVFEQFAPGHRLLDWLMQRFFPLDFHVAIVVSTVLLIGALLLLYGVLCELWGTGWGPVLATAAAGASLVNIGTAQWWASAAHRMPSNALSLLAMYAFLRFRRTDPRVHGRRTHMHSRPAGPPAERRADAWYWVSVAAFAGAVLFSFTALFVPVYLGLLGVLILDDAYWVRRWRIWTPFAVVIAGAVTVYEIRVAAAFSLPSIGGLFRFAQIAWCDVFVPGFVGVTRPSTAEVVVLQLAVVAIVAGSIWRSRDAWRIWVFFAVAVGLNLLFMGLTRTTPATLTTVAHGYRYDAEINWLAAITLAGAFPPATTRVMRAALALALVVDLAACWVGAGIVSSTALWDGPIAASFVSHLRRGLSSASRAGGPVQIVDGIVPDTVVPLLFGPYNRFSQIVPLLGVHAVYDQTSGRLWSITPTGDVEPVTFVPRAGGAMIHLLQVHQLAVARADATTISDGNLCITSGALPGVLALALLPPLPSADWHLVMPLVTNRAGAVFVYIDHGPQFVPAPDPYYPVHPGAYTAVMDLGGPELADVLIELPVRSETCISTITIGQLVARA